MQGTDTYVATYGSASDPDAFTLLADQVLARTFFQR